MPCPGFTEIAVRELPKSCPGIAETRSKPSHNQTSHNQTHHRSKQHRYSIASLVRASNVCGTLRPSALAVVRLIRSATRVSGKCRSTSLRRLLGQTSLKGHSFFQFDDIGVTSAYPNRMLAFTLILDQRGNADQDSQR
jgi:hypothetical protein